MPTPKLSHELMQEALKALEGNNGSHTAASKALGINRETLRHRVMLAKLHCVKENQPKPFIASKRHLVIPDGQVKDGVPLEHWTWIGKYIAEKRPDSIINIGDFADMPSLSSYDVCKKSFEGRRYKKDIDASLRGMDLLMNPIAQASNYNPLKKLTLGNHEHRIDRAVENDPKLDGLISTADLKYGDYGWGVVPFLEPVKIDGIEYVHYVTSGVMGRAAASAQVALRERQCSVVQGHVQHVDIAIHKKTQNFALFSGICYQHTEEYLGAQGNGQKPGIWVLNEVCDGQADLLQISLNYLRRRYG